MFLESSVLIGVTRWPSLVSWRALLMRTRHVEIARRTRSFAIREHSCVVLRRHLSGDSAIVSCGGRRRASVDKDKCFSCRKRVRQKRSPVQRKRGNHFNWLRVFGQEPPSMAIRSFYADIFEIKAQSERELQLKAQNERILEWRRALENGVQEIEISSSDVWQCLASLKKGKPSLDGVTAEMLLALPEEQILCLARNVQCMLSSLNFQETWSGVMASPSHQLSDHISQTPGIHLVAETASHLLEDPHRQLSIPHRQDAEPVYMIERGTELAREWSIPVFIAQLDLKKAFDRIYHDSIAEMLCRKDLRPQLVAVLCSRWCCSSLEVCLGHVTSDRCISVDRGVPQSAPESLLFVMVADEILGGLRPHWEWNNFAWACDEVSLGRLGYAGDVLLFSRFKTSPEAMIEDCCKNFWDAGLEVGLDTTHWSSSIAMDGETLVVQGQSAV